MRIGIIGAMKEEMKMFEKELKSTKRIDNVLMGAYGKHRLFVINSGIGKVNAARAAEKLLSEYHCNLIINTGLCGSLSKNLARGTFLVAMESIQHDVRAEPWGYKRGEIPQSNLRIFKSDSNLVEKAKELGAHPVRLLTGDAFISDESATRELIHELNGQAVDMEGGAIAQVCTLERTPFVLLKIVSDNADKEAVQSFEEFLKESAKILFEKTMALINKIPTKRKSLKETIRTIPNFPKEGIMFRDITTLLLNPDAFREVIEEFAARLEGKQVDAIAGIESRGFIFGAPLAYKLGVKFIPIRKKGKLPGKTIKQSYKLEYGEDTIEVHEDAINKNEKIVVVDDLIATGGTVKAAIDLVRKASGEVVDTLFVINLPDLKGLEKLDAPAFFLVEFQGD